MATPVLAAEADIVREYLADPAMPDDALDVEGNAVKSAMDRLQTLLAPTPLLDAEVASREADAAHVLRGGSAYKSPYHDAHHATLVAAAAALKRALGDGGPGTGFAHGAEHAVRDAAHLISGAAQDALRRDQGELPRLFDIALKLRKDRDDARAAARQLVLAFGREKRGLGFKERQRMRDAVVAARDQAARAAEEDKARLMDQFRAQSEELELLHRQVMTAREAPASRVARLEADLASERRRRSADAAARDDEREASARALEEALARVADLTNQLSTAKRETARAREEAEGEAREAREVAEAAERRASHAREVLARSKRRATRLRAFQLWRLRASFEAQTRHVKAEAAVTLRAVKRGYEVQLAETQRRGEEKLLAASLRPSEPVGGGKALADATNAAKSPAGGKRRNAAGASGGDDPDPWGFLGKVEAEKDKLRGESRLGGPARTAAARRAAEDAAVAAAEENVRKVDAYYAEASAAGRRRAEAAAREIKEGETYHPETVLLATDTPMETPPGSVPTRTTIPKRTTIPTRTTPTRTSISRATPSRTPPPSAPRGVDGVPSPTRATIASSSMKGRFERASVRPRAEEERDEVRTSTTSTTSVAVEPVAARRPESAAGARASVTSIRSHATLDYTDEFDEDFDEEELELP